MATSVSWSVHRLFEQRTDGWTTPDSNSTGTSSVCLPNSTWDFFISIYRAAQRMNCQVCFRSWPSLHPHTCRQHVWWDIPTELKVTVSGSDLSAVRQRKCFRAGRRLTWPAPPHRPPQVTELNFVTSCFSYRKRKDELLFTFLPLLKTSDACFSFTSWLLSASSSSEHRPCEVDPQTRLPPLSEHHEGTHTEPLLAEDFHNKSPAGQRVRQIKPTKSPENVHILQKYIFKKFMYL